MVIGGFLRAFSGYKKLIRLSEEDCWKYFVEFVSTVISYLLPRKCSHNEL